MSLHVRVSARKDRSSAIIDSVLAAEGEDIRQKVECELRSAVRAANKRLARKAEKKSKELEALEASLLQQQLQIGKSRNSLWKEWDAVKRSRAMPMTQRDDAIIRHCHTLAKSYEAFEDGFYDKNFVALAERLVGDVKRIVELLRGVEAR